MAKFKMEDFWKALGRAAGAVVIPGFVMGFGVLDTVLNNQFMTTSLGVNTVTVGSLLLATGGVIVVDMLFFNK